MRVVRRWNGAWLAVVVLLPIIAAVGCGSSESAVEPKWQQATSATGNYVAEFPGRPTTRSQEAPGTRLTAQFTTFATEGEEFTLAETELHGATQYPLDVAIDDFIESARAGQQESAGHAVTATGVSRSTGNLDGVETRRVTFDLVDGTDSTRIGAMIFYRDDAIVQAIGSTGDGKDPALIEHFLSSVKSRR